MIKLTDHVKDMNQIDAIDYWNNQKLPMASMETVGKAVEEHNSEAIEQIRKNCEGFEIFLSSSRIIYNTNNLGGKVIHNFGSKYAKQTTITLKEIPYYTDEPLQSVLATTAGLAYVRAIFNLPKATPQRLAAILETLSQYSTSKIRFLTPLQSCRTSTPQRALWLFYYDGLFRVGGNGWVDISGGLSRGVRSELKASKTKVKK